MRLNRGIIILVCVCLGIMGAPWSIRRDDPSPALYVAASELLPQGTRIDTLEWTKEYVQKILALEIWESRDSQDAFQVVKRGDFVRWLVKARNIPHQESQHIFSDLDPTDPNYPYIMTALEAGIIEKTPSFRPKDPLLRADASIWLVNTHGDLAKKRALEYSEPLIPAQDGYDGIPERAIGTLSTCYAPDYQLMEYRQLAFDPYRYVQAETPLLTGEAAYSLYQLVYPPKRWGDLVIGATGSIYSLFYSLDIWSSIDISSLIYEREVRAQNQIMGVFPGLIKRVPTQDNGLWKINYDDKGNFLNMEVTFELRKGIKWCDGSTITADDFVFGFYLLNHPRWNIGMDQVGFLVDKAEAVDENTFKTTWNTLHLECATILPMPRRYFEEKLDYHLEPYNLNDPSYYIPPKDDEDEGFESEKYQNDASFVHSCIFWADYDTKPVHAGPYRVVSWEKGDSWDSDKDEEILLEANEHYIFGPPLIPRISIKIFPGYEEDNLMHHIINNNIHIAFAISSGYFSGINQKEALTYLESKDPTHDIHFTPIYDAECIEFNVDDPLLSDVRIRQALWYSINPNTLSSFITNSKQSVLHSWFLPHHPSYDPSILTDFKQDTQKAARLLEEAGWLLNPETNLREKNGEVFHITFITNGKFKFRVDVQSKIIADWEKLGIKVTTDNENYDDFYFEKRRKRQFDGPTAHLISLETFPNDFFYPAFHSERVPSEANKYSGFNYTGYQNEHADQLINEMANTLDQRKIYQNLSLLNTQLLKDLPSFPLFSYLNIIASHKKLANFSPTNHSPYNYFYRPYTNSAHTWNAAYWYWKSEESTSFFPKISLKPEKLNFFNVARGIKSLHKITITNEGANLLKGSLHSDSSCLTLGVSQFSIEPKQSQEIAITLDPDKIKQAGSWSSSIEISSNDPDRPKITLPAQATLLSPILQFSPKDIDFGTLRKSNPPLQKLEISNEGGENLELALSSEHPALQLSETQLTIPPRVSKSIMFKLDLSLIQSYGAFEGTLNIESNDPEQAQVRIPFKGSYGVVIQLQIGQSKATVNSEELSLDVPPTIQNGRTLVPLRFIGEAFGATVAWESKTRAITLSLHPRTIRLWIDNPKAVIESAHPDEEPVKEIILEIPPQIINGRTMVPIRFISEAFGAKVEWEAKTQTITIYYKP